jgi:hypothetical protein
MAYKTDKYGRIYRAGTSSVNNESRQTLPSSNINRQGYSAHIRRGTSLKLIFIDNPSLTWGLALTLMYFLAWVLFKFIQSNFFDLDTTMLYIIQAAFIFGFAAGVGLLTQRIGLGIFLVIWNTFSFFVHTMNALGPSVEKYWPDGFLQAYYFAPKYMLPFCALLVTIGLVTQFATLKRFGDVAWKIMPIFIAIFATVICLLIGRHFSPSDHTFDPLLRFLHLL